MTIGEAVERWRAASEADDIEAMDEAAGAALRAHDAHLETAAADARSEARNTVMVAMGAAADAPDEDARQAALAKIAPEHRGAFLAAAPEPKRLAALPFGEPEPAAVLWRDGPGARYVDAVLSEGKVAILSAPGGTGKSTLTLQVALAAVTVTAGGYRTACGLRVRPGPVVLVSYEDSPIRMAARVRRMDPDADPAQIRHWPDPGPLYVGFESGREEGPTPEWGPLWAAVRAMDPVPSIVVIDPVSATLDGVSMNEGGPVRTFMGALAREAKAARCGVLMVAHDTKAARDASKEGNDPGAGAVAGSATWFDAARSALYLSGKGDNGRRELRCLKANYGRAGWTVSLAERFDGTGRFAGFEVATTGKATGGFTEPPPV